MATFKAKAGKISSSYPFSCIVRNYLGSCKLYETRTVEYNDGEKCHVAISLYRKGHRSIGSMFSVSHGGTKNSAYEVCYEGIAEFLDNYKEFVTQGNDLLMDDDTVVDKKENVIIEGAEESVTEPLMNVKEKVDLRTWSSTEGYYDFQTGGGSIMNRWFPLDSVVVKATSLPETGGGLLKNWVLPQDLINNNFDAINVLPMRGFMLGKYEMEFKLVLQANPFQACCVMLSVAPYSYGLIHKFESLKGFRQYEAKVRADNLYPERTKQFTYFDYQVAVQRKHVILDVSTGGEATIGYRQCMHRTLARNFDFSQSEGVNPGIRGSNVGNLCLHILSRLRVGSNNESSFNVRVFYRFNMADLTAMTQTVEKKEGAVLQNIKIPAMRIGKYATTIPQAHKNDLKNRTNWEMEKIKKEIGELQTQGPVMSIIGGAKMAIDIVEDTVKIAEKVGETSRKGFGSRNRDKPNDVVGVVKVVPRPRQSFVNGEAVDDTILMGVSHVERTEFYEVFEDEPTNFRELFANEGYLSRFIWDTTSRVGLALFKWNLHPTQSPDRTYNRLDGNELRNPLSIFSSAFTYYCGTMVLRFQIVKTMYHRGALEISVHFGKQVDTSNLSSSYVKVINVQETSSFELTVPYIYDTPVRLLAGTTVPMGVPSLSSNEYYSLAHTATVKVRVLNELTAPTSVHREVEVLVWLRAGDDFSLMFPHAMNSVTSPINQVTFCQNPFQVRKYMKSNENVPYRYYDLVKGEVLEVPALTGFTVQGDEDFQQGSYTGNRITTIDHMNFKSLMKMPIKILSNYSFEATREMEVKDSLNDVDEKYTVANYVNIPVACLNNTLVTWLRAQVYSEYSTMGPMALYQSIQAQISSMFGMFRGSLIYTVVLKKGDVIYVQYLPHDYKLRSIQSSYNEDYQIAKFEESQKLTGVPSFQIGCNSKQQLDLASMGCYSTFMCRSVNPSERFEIPMGTQSNWMLLNRRIADDSTSGIYTMRENSEWFNGHLVLWTTDDKATVDVYVNCADDFEFGGFLGHVGVCNPYSCFALEDKWRTQGLDFKLRDLTLLGWKSVSESCCRVFGGLSFGLLTAMHGVSVPAVTGALALYCAVGGVTQVMELRNVLRAGKRTVEEVKDQVQDILESGSGMLFELLVRHFPWMSGSHNIRHSLWNIGQNIVHAVISRNWVNCAFSAFNILMETRMFELADWEVVKRPFEFFFQNYVNSEFVTQGVCDAWDAMMEVIVTLVTMKLQVKNSGGIVWYLKEIFQWQNYNNIRGLSSVLSLLRMFLKSVSRILEWAFQEADPNVSLLKALSAQDEQLGEFLEESNLYLNSFNDQDFKRKEMRVRFLHVILRAFKLRLVLLKIANPRLTSQLLGVCNKVIEKAQKQRYLFKCDLVKMEPFVLCIEGSSGIGKSFAVYDVASRMLEAVDLKVQNPDLVFTIPAGVQYWNGYADQPVVWYDDWCNLADEETMRMHISQLYALKTSAPFNVPRAEIENKEQVANPLVVVMTTNSPFPVSPIFTDKNAVYRRRDMLVHFEAVPGMKIDAMTQEQLADFQHLQIKIYGDATRPDSLIDRVYTYSEFIAMLQSRFVRFYNKEMENKQRKYDILMRNVRSMRVDSLNLGNPFDLIDKIVMEDETLLTSQLLDREVEVLLDLIQNQVRLSESSVLDEDMFEVQGIGDVQRWVVRRSKNFSEKFKGWMSNVRAKLIVCEMCQDSAHVHGTTMWCTEGSHYMCFHCALLSKAVRHPIERNGEATDEYQSSFVCGIHNTLLEIHNKDFLSSLLAEIIYNKIDIPFKLYSFFKGVLGGAPLPNKLLYGLLIMAQVYVKCLSRAIFGPFQTQGWTSSVELDSFIVNSNFYKSEDMVVSENLRERFDGIGRIEPKMMYVCMHSLLDTDYAYFDGKFTILEDGFEIDDQWCRGKCCLSNVSFLNRVKTNLQISMEYVDLFKCRRVEVIRKYFPRFLWPSDMIVIEGRLHAVKKMFSRSWWENYVSSINPRINKYLKFVVPLLVGCAGLWATTKFGIAVWNLIKKFFGIELETEGKYGEYRDKKKRKVGKPKVGNVYSTQSSTLNFENKLNKIMNNYILVIAGKVKMTAWGVKGSTFVIPKHLLARIRCVDKVEIVSVMKDHEKIMVAVDDLSIVEYERKDLALVTIRGVRMLFRDCSRFVAPRASRDIDYLKAVMLDVNVEEREVYEVEVDVLSLVQGTSAMSPDGKCYSTDIGLLYGYERGGLCGSLLCRDSEFPIVSMHVSGSSSIGKGIGVLLESFDFAIQSVPMVEDCEVDTVYYGDDVNISYEASLPRDLVPYLPQKSGIVPSLISEMFKEDSVMRPAFLGIEEGYKHEYHPVFYGVRKNGRPPVRFPRKFVEMAYGVVSSRVLSGRRRIRRPGILSVREAVMGLPGVCVDDKYDDGMDPYYGSMVLSTSAGWPYTTERYKKKYGIGTNSKSGWISLKFGEDGLPEDCVVHDCVMTDLEEAMKWRRQGIPAVNVFQDCLKDEKRGIGKACSEGGTRLFSMSNIHGTIALRQYTLDMIEHMRINRISNSIGVGINPDSMEWTVLANVLLSRGNNIFTTDFTNFGASLDYEVAGMFADMIVEFYGLIGEDVNVVVALVEELIASRHVVGNLVYRAKCGSPSGASVTVEMNSFVHLMYVVVAWIIISRVYSRVIGLAPEHSKEVELDYGELEEYLIGCGCVVDSMDLEDFKEHVAVVVYGDDGIFSVSDGYRELFNAVTVNLVLKVHGIGVTDASKSERIVKYSSLSEATFLKRRFVENELMPHLLYASVMEWKVVEECVRWIHKNPYPAEVATRENCMSSLLLCWGHGSVRFHEWREELNRYLKRVGLDRIDLTWDDLAMKFYPDLKWKDEM